MATSGTCDKKSCKKTPSKYVMKVNGEECIGSYHYENKNTDSGYPSSALVVECDGKTYYDLDKHQLEIIRKAD